MKILVSNIGSTSFKFRLFDMDGRTEREIASGGADRIGGAGGVMKWQIGGGAKQVQSLDFADHGAAILHVLEVLRAGGALKSNADLAAVAFKAVMAGDFAPVARVDDALLARMEYFIPIAPVHNPPYIAAMKMFRTVLGSTPLVAAFEPGFHRTIPARRKYFAVPMEWAAKYGVQKYGFHGASHRYIATRTAELMGQAARRVISCHLGGSSSICAIRDGQSVATSMGLSPQSGLPQGTRAGEFDSFGFALLKSQAGMDADAVLKALGNQSGLAALSGTSGDMRDICEAASGKVTVADGGVRARMTMELFVTAVRDFVGAYMVELGGADALVFTGGIAENNAWLRTQVCQGMEFAGVQLDAAKNDAAAGEARVDASGSRTAVWVMPTNEELIVARLAVELLGHKN